MPTLKQYEFKKKNEMFLIINSNFKKPKILIIKEAKFFRELEKSFVVRKKRKSFKYEIYCYILELLHFLIDRDNSPWNQYKNKKVIKQCELSNECNHLCIPLFKKAYKLVGFAKKSKSVI